LLGIIFTGGQGPDTQIVKGLIEQETKGALFIAADSGLLAAVGAGIKPDWVIGDMDSLSDTQLLDSFPPERVIRFRHQDKDHTDTELAVFHAVKQGCNDIWIIGGGGGRNDHFFAVRSLFERDIFPCRWITDNADICCIDADTARREVCCCLEKEAAVSVFPLGGGPWKAKSAGLKWPLDCLFWDRGFFSLSNIAVNGEFTIEAERGRFMVVLPLLFRRIKCQQ
jgi:thiamine pyrophosphokinase